MSEMCMYCVAEESIEVIFLIISPWAPQSALLAARLTELTRQLQLQLAAVSGCSGKMLPCVHYLFVWSINSGDDQLFHIAS